MFIIRFLNPDDADKFKWENIPKIKLTNTIDNVVDWDAEVDNNFPPA